MNAISQGTGSAVGNSETTCPTCKGAGLRIQAIDEVRGFVASRCECESCRGTGRIPHYGKAKRYVSGWGVVI